MQILAEVSDKVGSFSSTAAMSGLIALGAIVLARFRWWLVLLPIPLYWLWGWIEISEIQETAFATTVVLELGTDYYANQLIAIYSPFVVALGALFVWRARLFQFPTDCTA